MTDQRCGTCKYSIYNKDGDRFGTCKYYLPIQGLLPEPYPFWWDGISICASIDLKNDGKECPSWKQRSILDLEKLAEQMRKVVRKDKAWSRRTLKMLRDQKKVALKENFKIGRCSCGTVLPQGQSICGMCSRY